MQFIGSKSTCPLKRRSEMQLPASNDECNQCGIFQLTNSRTIGVLNSPPKFKAQNMAENRTMAQGHPWDSGVQNRQDQTAWALCLMRGRETLRRNWDEDSTAEQFRTPPLVA
jgi:hypothetical protein